jgi:hypothetical protein
MEALRQLYAEGGYDFHFATLLIGATPIGSQQAYDRAGEYNLSGTPVLFFDGGYLVDLGAKPDIPTYKTAYGNALAACEARTVEDIDIDLNVQWHGNAVMNIAVTVQNNETVSYGGHLRVYITEIQSSLGWNDLFGVPYDSPLLDFAFNEPITIPGGSTWESSTLWDGKLHDNGWGTGYGTIQHDNIRVVAVVFNDEWHQGYSDPPTNNYPFDAYYVDETAAAVPEASLLADTYTVSETGGTVNFFLQAGKDNAFRNYLLVGSITGTDPGTPLPGGLVTLPLNWDLFTNLVINMINSPTFHNFMGALNVYGGGTAQLNLKAVPPGFVGTFMHYAYALKPYDMASNPVGIEIVP